jgi:hypothetical protein
MEQPSVEQNLHDLWNATGHMQVHGQSFTAGLEVAQHGGALADAFEIVNAPLNACAMRDRQKVQHRIGTSHRGFHFLTCNHKVNFTRKNAVEHEAQLN